ncbi:MAG: response regulator receiver protein [Deltaproteobacteria bacterium]|nr:response regulator receiver protein [Deltaproteobacteria bacterium]
MRVLEVSLRKAGFTVTSAVSVQDALDKLELDAPDLIISETAFPDGDGFELRRRVRATPEWGEIPFIFLTAEAAIENKIRGLELGVDDYLTKPIYIKEIVTRINILLQKRQRLRFEERRDGRTRFAGRVADMPVVDVIQTIEISRKSGVIQFVGDRGRQAAIYFRDGRVIDAEAGALQGEDAVYRLLTWSEGEFEVVFRTVRRREVIMTSSQGLLMEGMRRLDEWSRLLEQLPALTHRFEVDAGELAARLGDVPDDNNSILRLIDGKRTLLEVIDAAVVGDLECLQAISKLYFEEMLIDLDQGAPVRRDTGKPIPLVEVDAPTPIEEVGSGPIHDDFPEVIEEDSEPGALMGGYRASSLMLIDAAVAAAQAIEPSLFDDEVDALVNGPNAPAARQTSNDASAPGPDAAREWLDVPTATDEDATPQPVRRTRLGVRPQVSASREESGLRMIGSLGRDRAEASGELVPLGATEPGRGETQRELITILPRRATRDGGSEPTGPDAGEGAEGAEGVSSASSASVTPRLMPVVTPFGTPAVPTPVVTPAATGKAVLPLPTRPSGTSLISPRANVRSEPGPGKGALALLVLAGLLTAIAVFLYLSRGSRSAAIRSDAAVESGLVVPRVGSAEVLPDAPALAMAADAGSAASRVVTPDAAIPVDPAQQAKLLMEQANDAVEEGDFDKALKLADASIRLRKTARTFLVKAQALQRLGRVDDALAAIDAAELITKEFPGTYELRARILRSARRKDEAREAMEQYLKLVHSGPTAAQFARWLTEPE